MIQNHKYVHIGEFLTVYSTKEDTMKLPFKLDVKQDC